MNGLTPFKNKKVYRNIQKLTIKINKVKKNKLFVLIQINQLIWQDNHKITYKIMKKITSK